ncbi:protein kinase [Streptomyces sp. NPDC058659]
MPLEAGDPRQIGAFRLLGVLGSGGMGRVYLGAVPGKFAAVKRVLPVLAEDADFLSHFGHELDNLSRLPAGANTKLLASDRTAKPPWFATEFIPGITLSEAVRLHGGPLPAVALWRLLRDAAAGLRVVHGADMVHRDLKPSNVMLTGDGLSLIDFGVARAADQSRLTRTGMVIGTPAYMAPEQAVADRQLTGAADVFALGSLVLYAANGRPPFGEGSGPDLLYRVVHGEPDFGKLTETDPELAALVRTCFAKDPADRPTAAELVELVDRADEGAAGAAWPAAVADRIGERAAFAAGAPTAEHLAELERIEPAQDVATASLTPQRGQEPATASPDAVAITGAATPEKRTRRNRFVMLAVPVVVATGTTLTVALGPYEIGRLGAAPDTSGSPSAVASQPAPGDPAAAPSSSSAKPGPSTSASASSSASSGPSSAPPGGSTTAQPPGTGDAGGGGGTIPGGGSGSGAGSNTGSGSGSKTTSPGGGGSTTTSPGGGGGGSATTQPAAQPSRTTTRPAPPPPPPSTGGSVPSGTYSIENVSSGECVSESHPGYGGVMVNTAPCGTPPNSGTITYSWTYSSTGNGAFRLVNKKTGLCLQPGGTPGFTAKDCNGSSLQSWTIGTKTSAGHTIKNVNSGECMIPGPPFLMTYTCDPSDRAHLWRNIAPV